MRKAHPTIERTLLGYSCVLGRSVGHGATPREAYEDWSTKTHPGRLHRNIHGFDKAIIVDHINQHGYQVPK